MKRRLRRLLHGEECAGCHKTFRIRWYSNTGCHSLSCLQLALIRIDYKREHGPFPWDKDDYRLGIAVDKDDNATIQGRVHLPEES